MHDSSGTDSTASRILPALIAFLLLASIPVLFRKPSTTLTDLKEIAIHASAFSLSDSAWSGNCWFYDGIEPPLPGEVAFGKHALYPYNFITARDVRTGDVLIRIHPPITVPPDENPINYESLHISAFGKDTDTYVLIHQENSESWPVNLFSIITNG